MEIPGPPPPLYETLLLLFQKFSNSYLIVSCINSNKEHIFITIKISLSSPHQQPPCLPNLSINATTNLKAMLIKSLDAKLFTFYIFKFMYHIIDNIFFIILIIILQDVISHSRQVLIIRELHSIRITYIPGEGCIWFKALGPWVQK